MAIHNTVYRTADRRIRVTADRVGSAFTVEVDRAFHARATSLGQLEAVLTELNVKIEDLIED
jgi:hypothetical protein